MLIWTSLHHIYTRPRQTRLEMAKTNTGEVKVTLLGFDTLFAFLVSYAWSLHDFDDSQYWLRYVKVVASTISSTVITIMSIDSNMATVNLFCAFILCVICGFIIDVCILMSVHAQCVTIP